VTSLVIEQFHTPDTHRRARRLESVRRRAAERLAGRSVWCIAAVLTEEAAADALEHCLRAAHDDGAAPHRTLLELGEPLQGLMERLDAMLRGVTMLSPAFGPVEEDAYRKGRQDGDALLPGDVQAGDVVVLHDAAALAQPIRDRGPTQSGARRLGMGERCLRRGSFCTARGRVSTRTSPRGDPIGPPGPAGPGSPHTSRLLRLYRRRRSTRAGPVRATRRSVGRPFSRMSCVTIAPSGSGAPSARGRRWPPAERPAPRP